MAGRRTLRPWCPLPWSPPGDPLSGPGRAEEQKSLRAGAEAITIWVLQVLAVLDWGFEYGAGWSGAVDHRSRVGPAVDYAAGPGQRHQRGAARLVRGGPGRRRG